MNAAQVFDELFTRARDVDKFKYACALRLRPPLPPARRSVLGGIVERPTTHYAYTPT